MNFYCINIISSHSYHDMFRLKISLLQGGKSKNAEILIIGRDHSTFKNRTILVKIPAVLPFNRNFNQNYTIFMCGLVLKHYKYICILALTSMKMTTQ